MQSRCAHSHEPVEGLPEPRRIAWIAGTRLLLDGPALAIGIRLVGTIPTASVIRWGPALPLGDCGPGWQPARAQHHGSRRATSAPGPLSELGTDIQTVGQDWRARAAECAFQEGFWAEAHSRSERIVALFSVPADVAGFPRRNGAWTSLARVEPRSYVTHRRDGRVRRQRGVGT